MSPLHEHRCVSCDVAIMCSRERCGAVVRCAECRGKPVGSRELRAIADRERACLRGEHEATGAALEIPAIMSGTDGRYRGNAKARWCAHCRAVLIPRQT